MKFGTQGAYHIHNDYAFAGTNQLTYRFNSLCALRAGAPAAPAPADNGSITPVPNQFTMRIAPRHTSNRTTFQAFYAQDQWTMKRLTVQGALRYEWAKSWAPEGENGIYEASRFNAGRSSFPRTESVRGYHDISPRVGVAYDVFGTGKTALKVNLGHYLASANNEGNFTINNPVSQLQLSHQPDVDRCERRLHAGLRPHEPGDSRTRAPAAATSAAPGATPPSAIAPI